MGYTFIKKIPPFETFMKEIPLSEEGYAKIRRDRQEIQDILSGKDRRLLIIIGPCSAWPREAVIAYAKKLQLLSESFSDVLKIVMRVYIQKPRTTKGWTGPLNQPDPFHGPDIEAGIRYVRRMMVDVINIGLPISDEAVFTHNASGFNELLSWLAIGARSSEDQEHRVLASGCDCPVGLKNPTHGPLHIAVNSVIAAQHPHVAVFDGNEVQTDGNPFAHLVLRGSSHAPNYSVECLEEARSLLLHHHIKNPAILIDASHDNCIYEGKKDHHRQDQVVFETLDVMKSNADLKALIKGFMIESFLKDGHQKLDPSHPDQLDLGGLSITDPCLSWESTELLLREIVWRLR